MKRYEVGLDPNKLYQIADELDEYAKDFENKVRIFLERLADLGISVAQAHEGVYSGTIVYSKEFEAGAGSQTVNMVAQGTSVTSEWFPTADSQEVRTEEINTLLMAEFGSGRYAIDFENLGGQGTLNGFGHANNVNGWYWWADTPPKDGDAQKIRKGRTLYHSDGLAPARPLHSAVMECIRQIEGIAREVFT